MWLQLVATGCNWLQLVATSLFTSHRKKATRNCSPVASPSKKLQLNVKTGFFWLGPDEGGKCDSIRLSAVCLSKVATICSMVVAVA